VITKSGPINERDHWDDYVKKWGKNKEYQDLKYLGNEWHGEKTFLELLKKYSSKSYHALEIGWGGGWVTSQAADWLGHIDAADVSRKMLRKC